MIEILSRWGYNWSIAHHQGVYSHNPLPCILRYALHVLLAALPIDFNIHAHLFCRWRFGFKIVELNGRRSTTFQMQKQQNTRIIRSQKMEQSHWMTTSWGRTQSTQAKARILVLKATQKVLSLQRLQSQRFKPNLLKIFYKVITQSRCLQILISKLKWTPPKMYF